MKFAKVRDKKLNLDYGYMLIIESEDELMEYHHKATSPKLRSIWDNIIAASERRSHFNSSMAYAIAYAADGKKSLVQLTQEFLDRVINNQLVSIKRSGRIYVSQKGGYFGHHSDIEIEDEIILEDNQLIFPNLTEKDIEIKQWEGGKHWYAYVGGMWVSDIYEKTKFDTKEKAMDVAKWNLWQMNKKMYIVKE